MRRRICPANIATDDRRFRAQFFQRPGDIVQTEFSVLPVRHRLPGSQTIEIDRDVNFPAREPDDETGKFVAPVRAKNCAASLLIFRRPIIRPRVYFERARAFRTPVSKNLPRPPALKIPTTPHAHFPHLRQFKRAIHPTAATPAWRADIPVRMIIEGDHDDRRADLPKPKSAQVMKISRAVKCERRQPRAVFFDELFNHARRRAEAQTRPPNPRIEPRQIEPAKSPGVVQIEMQRGRQSLLPSPHFLLTTTCRDTRTCPAERVSSASKPLARTGAQKRSRKNAISSTGCRVLSGFLRAELR